MKIKATATLYFETKDTWEKAVQSITGQIISDCNGYYCNDDDTQMTQLKLKMTELLR